MTNIDTLADAEASAGAASTPAVLGEAFEEILSLLADQDLSAFRGDQVPDGAEFKTGFIGNASDLVVCLSMLCQSLETEYNRVTELVAMASAAQRFRVADGMPVEDDPSTIVNKQQAGKLRTMYHSVHSWMKLEAIAMDVTCATKSIVFVDKDRNLCWAEPAKPRRASGFIFDGGDVTMEELERIIRGADPHKAAEENAAPVAGDS